MRYVFEGDGDWQWESCYNLRTILPKKLVVLSETPIISKIVILNMQDHDSDTLWRPSKS